MTTMTAQATQVYQLFIKATPEAIWDAITKPEWNAKYGYPGTGEYDLRPGGRYLATADEAAQAMGMPELLVEGEVIEADPPRKLVQTWRMVMDDDMAAEGFTRLTYEIEASSDGVTKLTVIHEVEGAPSLAALLAGEQEDAGAGGGWSWVLSSLKTLLETGVPLEG